MGVGVKIILLATWNLWPWRLIFLPSWTILSVWRYAHGELARCQRPYYRALSTVWLIKDLPDYNVNSNQYLYGFKIPLEPNPWIKDTLVNLVVGSYKSNWNSGLTSEVECWNSAGTVFTVSSLSFKCVCTIQVGTWYVICTYICLIICLISFVQDCEVLWENIDWPYTDRQLHTFQYFNTKPGLCRRKSKAFIPHIDDKVCPIRWSHLTARQEV